MTTTNEIKHATIRDLLRHPLPRARVPGVPKLSLATRCSLLAFGWLMIGVGILGLVLPGLQGFLTIFFGAAVLSLVSRTMLNTLRFLLRPWPKAWRTLLRSRRRIHRWISRNA